MNKSGIIDISWEQHDYKKNKQRTKKLKERNKEYVLIEQEGKNELFFKEREV